MFSYHQVICIMHTDLLHAFGPSTVGYNLVVALNNLIKGMDIDILDALMHLNTPAHVAS